MTDEQEREAARLELIDLVEPDAEPSLTPDEIEKILDRSRRAITWAANSIVTLDDVIYPTVRNGRRYRVIKPGNLGATEPTFLVTNNLWPGGSGNWDNRLRQFTSGGVTLQEDGDEFQSLYNVHEAARRAWDKKCAKASQFISTPGINMADIYKRCVEMRDSFDSVLIA